MELIEGALNGFQEVVFKLLEGILNGEDVLTVIVFLVDLVVEPVIDATLENIRVMLLFDLVGGGGIKGCRVLSQKLNVLLCQVAGLLDGFGALQCAGAQLLGLVFDFLVQALEGREHSVLDTLFALEVHV